MIKILIRHKKLIKFKLTIVDFELFIPNISLNIIL